MKGDVRIGAFTVGLAALWATTGEALDPTKCKAKINNSDGVILVKTEGVTGVLQWGPAAGQEVFPLFNTAGTCVNPDPKNCQLGAAGTPERLYPPEGCVVYLKDTGDASTCSAYIKKCVPGRRPCPSDMATVGGICIDKYEASVWSSPGGGTQYFNTYPCNGNGQDCNNIYARSVAGAVPSGNMTWFQAQQACANSGKRLLTNTEWQTAVSGSPDPGGDNGTTDCNTGAYGNSVVTGSRSSCVSRWGNFDMVGNMWEYVADWLPPPTACPGWGAFSNDQNCGYSGAGTTAMAPYAPLRGGHWNGSGSLAGPFELASGDVVLSIGIFVGFRCAR